MADKLFPEESPSTSLTIVGVELHPISSSWRSVKYPCRFCQKMARRWVTMSFEGWLLNPLFEYKSKVAWPVCLKCAEDVAARFPEEKVKRGR